MPKLSKFREYHYESTAKVSENTRTLAISAIAIVWLFKVKTGQAYAVPHGLQLPLLLVILALALDFFQYVYRSIAWHVFFRIKEGQLDNKLIDEETEIYASSWINFPSYVLFYSKILVFSAAYALLLYYLWGVVSWS